MLTLLILMTIITSSAAVLTVHWNVSLTSHTLTNICGNYRPHTTAPSNYPDNPAIRDIHPKWIRFEDNNKLVLCQGDVLGQNKNCVQFKFYSTGNKPGCLLLVFQNILC